MRNSFFQFKQFTVHHDRCAMKVTTDACLFGAWAAAEMQSLQVAGTALDVGSGTGLLSLMIAQKNNLKIDALEIDKEAAAQASENVKASLWADCIHIFKEDVLQWQPFKKYDIIFSNPPFYEKDLKSDRHQKNTAHHSTDLTLQQLVDFIKHNLAPHGRFFLLLPHSRLNECKDLMTVNKLYMEAMVTVKQSVLHSPFRILLRGSLQPGQKVEMTEMSIKENNQDYSEAFISLLKDYYLYL